jgi:sugar diacid utilization regulator
MVSIDEPAVEQVSVLKDLLVRSLRVIQDDDQADILRLVANAAEAIAGCEIEGILLDRVWQDIGWRGRRLRATDVVRAGRSPEGGSLTVANVPWAWVYPMPAGPDQAGYLVVGSGEQPTTSDHHLLAALARQAGAALADARARLAQRSLVADLRTANVALHRSMEIHDRLTQVTMRGGGQEGIVRAIYELTGYVAGIEDTFGNVVAWAGGNRPGSPGQHEHRTRRLHQLMVDAGPVRDGDRLISVARVAGAPVGAVVLSDPGRTAGVRERLAVEHAAAMLSMEVARMRSQGESRVRARANLALELVSGAEEPAVLSRAQALGYDLGRVHRVVTLEYQPKSGYEMDVFFRAVAAAADALAVGSLIAPRHNDVVVLADTEASWHDFQNRVETESHGLRCSIGIGGRCQDVAGFPRSHREAQLALRIQKAVGKNEKVTVFDELGVYQVLASEADASAMESFARDWLGSLLSYDAIHGTQLVSTLSEFLDCGGNYDAAATTLAVHRSTLKYRLKRIREVSGHNLGIPDIQFNLQVATRAWRTLQALRQP